MTPPDRSFLDDTADEPEIRDRPAWLPWVILPAMLIWLGATFWAVLRVFLEAGTQASSGLYSGSSFGFSFDVLHISVQPEVLTAFVIAAGPPVLGVLVALCWRRPLESVLLRLCVVLGVLGLLALAVTADPPPEQDRPRGCVEYSGGPSDCP